MTLPGPRFTYEDYKLLPEDQRHEVIEGDLLMTPAPTTRHQEILAEMLGRLRTFVRSQGLGRVLPAPVDVVLSEDSVVQPDILFVRQERLDIIDPFGGITGSPDLVVEILSPRTASRDRILKRKLYGKFGVREYWIVDPETRSIEVLTLASRGLETWKVFREGTEMVSPLLPGLTVAVTEIMIG